MADYNSTARFTADISQLKAEMQAAARLVRVANSEFKAATAGMDDWSSSADGLQAKLRQLNTTLDAQKKQLAAAQANLENVAKTYGENSAEADRARIQYNNYRAAVATTEAQLETYQRSLDEVTSGTKELDSATENSAQGFTVMRGALANLVSDGIKAAVDGLKDFARYAIEAGSAFESGMSQVQALSGASGSQLDALNAKARELGSSTQFSATETAEAMSAMSLAGWNTQQTLSGIDGVLQLAAAGGMELGQAADAVAGYLAAFNMQASEAGKLSDIMATAQAKSKTTTDQLAAAYGTCATNMAQAGQSVETTTALLEGMASVNDTGSAAGTHLAAVMAQITQKMEDGAITIGDTAIAVQDADGNFRDMIDIIEDVEGAVEGMGDAERAAALQQTFNRQSMSAMNELLSVGSERLRAYSDDLEHSSGAAADMMAVMNDNLEGSKKSFMSAAEGFGIALYDAIQEPLRAATDFGAGLLRGLTDFISPARSEMDLFLEDITASVDNANSLIAQSSSTIAGSAEQIGDIQRYQDTITALNDVEHLNELQKHDLRRSIESLIEIMPELAPLYDEENGRLKANTDEINRQIDSRKELIIQEAKEQATQEALSGLYEANLAAAKASDAVAATQARIDAIEQEKSIIAELSGEYESLQSGAFATEEDYLRAQQRSSEILDEMAQHGVNACEALYGTGDTMRAMDEELDNLYGDLRGLTGAQEDANAAVKNAQEAYKGAADGAEAAARETMEFVSKNDKLRTTYGQSTDSADGLKRELLDLKDAQRQAGEAAAGAENNVLLTRDAMQQQATAAETAQQSLGGYRDGIADLISGQQQAAATAQAASESMQQQAAAAETTGAAMELLSFAGETAAKGFGEAFQAAAAMATAAVDEARGQIHEYEYDIAQTQQDAAQNIMDAWDQLREAAADTIKLSIESEFDGGADLTTEEINNNLESQIAGYEAYYDNLQRLRELCAEGIISPEFFTNLEQQGTAAADMINNMIVAIDTGGEEGLTQLADMSERYTTLLDWRETIAGAIAGDQAALEQGLQALGSSHADFGDLRAAVDYALSGIDEDMRAKIDGLIATAEEIGVQIPDGLTSGLESGDVSAQELTDKLQASIDGSLDGLAQIATDAGSEVVDGIISGLQTGETTATEAYHALIDAIGKQGLTTTEDAGKTGGDAFAKGVSGAISDGAQEAADAATEVITAAKTAATTAAEGFSDAGRAAGTALASGITEQQGEVTGAAQATAAAGAAEAQNVSGEYNDAGANAGSNYVSGLNGQAGDAYSAGQNVASSGAQGISATGSSGAYIAGQNLGIGYVNGIRSMEQEAYNAGYAVGAAGPRGINDGQQSHSPSRLAYRSGQWLMQGYVNGIKDAAGDVITLARDTAAGAAKELLTMRAPGDFNISDRAAGLIDDTVGRQLSDTSDRLEFDAGQRLKTLNDRIDGYKKSSDAEADAIKEASDKRVKALQDAYDAEKESSEARQDKEKARSEKALARIKSRYEKEIKTEENLRDKQIKAAQKASEKRQKTIQDAINAESDSGKKSQYRQLLSEEKSYLSKHTQEIKDESKKAIDALKAARDKELETEKAASKKKIEAEKAALKKSETKNKNAIEKDKAQATADTKAVKDRYDALIGTETEYRDNYKEASRLMLDQFQNAMSSYKNAAEDLIRSTLSEIDDTYGKKYDELINKQNALVDKLKSAGSLFDVSSAGVMTVNDLQEQTRQITEYANKLQHIKRLVSGSLFDEIAQMDMREGSAYIDRLLSMDEAELNAYSKAYEDKMAAAAQAGETIYGHDIQSVSTGYADAVTNAFKMLPVKLKELGQQSIEGFVQGMQETKYVEDGVKAISDGLIQAFKVSLKIHSPSRVMRELGQFTSEGFGQGLMDMIGNIKDAAQRISDAAAVPLSGVRPNIAPILGSDIRAGILQGQAGGQVINNNYNLVQNNNSPKPLTALETYQARRAQINLIKAYS